MQGVAAGTGCVDNGMSTTLLSAVANAAGCVTRRHEPGVVRVATGAIFAFEMSAPAAVMSMEERIGMANLADTAVVGGLTVVEAPRPGSGGEHHGLVEVQGSVVNRF